MISEIFNRLHLGMHCALAEEGINPNSKIFTQLDDCERRVYLYFKHVSCSECSHCDECVAKTKSLRRETLAFDNHLIDRIDTFLASKGITLNDKDISKLCGERT